MTKSRAFGEEGPDRPHLVRGRGGLSGELRDVREDIEDAYTRLEGLVGYPKLFRVTGGSTALSLAALPTAKALVGEDLLQGQTKAALTLGAGTSQLDFTANRPGKPGNDITVELATGGAESIAVVGNAITVTLNTGTSTPDSIKTTVDADADAARLVQVVSGGAGVAVVAATTNLSGGIGEGFVVYVNGIAQEVDGPITDTALPLEVTDLTGAANLDQAQILVVSDGVSANPMQIAVAT